MSLPNASEAYVPLTKLKDYLISEKHPVGRSKARFFRSIGFNETNISQLEQELLTIAQAGQLKEVIVSQHGTKYVVDGTIKAPNGSSVRLRTVWIIETGQEMPRFVTAYPIE